MKHFLTALSLACITGVYAKTIYVAPNGNDKNAGTAEYPVASFEKAQQLARQKTKSESTNVFFARGVYYLKQTIQFTSADNNVNYISTSEGGAVLSGGSALQLNWKPYKNGIMVADIPANTVIDQLYINSVRQRMARYPNAISGRNVFDTWELSHKAKADSANNPLDAKRISSWSNPQGGYLHAMHNILWGDMHWLIKGKKADGTLDMEGGWQNNRPSKMHPVYRIVENIFEELDVPGEWFYNNTEHKLYYMPEPNTDIKKAKVEIVRLQKLIEFNGTKENPAKNIQLNGFIFRHTARTFMENKEPLLRSDWTVFRGGAVFFNGAEDCSITNCEFDQVGGNSVFVNNYNRRITIAGCYIHHSGASGVVFVGDPMAVRSPLFSYGKQNYETIDRTPGAKNDNYPENCIVDNCLITMTGRDEKQTAGIHISMSHKIRINHCSIYDMPRAGININEGTFGGHIIENCDVFNTVLETGDHGSFNSWGRDRYWSTDAKQTSIEVEKDTLMPFWDILDKNIIRNSRWRCDHGWDIDLDDGSTNYEIYNNLLLNRGLKLREGYRRIVTNNVIINSSMFPHVWFKNSGDVFRNNIVCNAYKPALMNKAIAENGKWGKEIDHNFFVTNKAEMTKYLINGCDSNSLNGNPLFVNASEGNFNVQDNSPALKCGFVNFPMNNFGVTKPGLKAIAKTPLLPVGLTDIKETESATKEVKKNSRWMNALLKEPSGDEMSAFGIGYDAGGVSLSSVEPESAASGLGLRTGDLIQTINGVKIKSIEELNKYLKINKGINKHKIKIIRNQVVVDVMVNRLLPDINSAD